MGVISLIGRGVVVRVADVVEAAAVVPAAVVVVEVGSEVD